MEKISTNREIIKITHIKNTDNDDPEAPIGAKTTHDSPHKFNSDLFKSKDHKSHSNALNTPMMQEYNLLDQENMKELKLFSRVDSYQPAQTVYFSNKILQKYLKSINFIAI
jgi:hypothetical protein